MSSQDQVAEHKTQPAREGGMLSRWLDIRPMPPRRKDQSHRAATPLELLFDLVSVIAIASAAAGLHHAIAQDHIADGLIHFIAAFFMIWWAWMNYAWFASAYDNDDTAFRLLTMLSMAGSLTIAAGINAFFNNNDLVLVVVGFVIMRLSMVSLWLRAAKHDPVCRKTALWYAAGISLAQLYWIGLLVFQSNSAGAFFSLFALGVVIELCVPMLAERQQATPWHRHHIIERYGLLNIIVLGETLLAATMALQHSMAEHVETGAIRIAVTALVILFSLWWLYFSREDHLSDDSPQRAFSWGYGHLLVFLGGTAVGAGVAVQVDIATHHASVAEQVGHWAVALPVAMYLAGIWFVRDRSITHFCAHWLLPFMALVIAVSPLWLGSEVVAIMLVVTVWWRNRYLADARPA